MVLKKATDVVKRKVIAQFIVSLNNLSDKNLVRIGSLLQKISPEHKDDIEKVKRLVKEKHPGIGLVRRILKEMHPKCRKRFIENLIIQGMLLNEKKRSKIIKEDSYAPFTVLISPTMRCNLKCEGCYAYLYNREDDMPFETMDRIIKEAKDMGVSFFTILGGEPFIYPHIFQIFEKHKDVYAQIYTNSTLLNEEKIRRIQKMGNIMPIISIEGFEKETDERRGTGVYKKIIKTMGLLKKYKVPFGFSVAVTRKNVETVSSDEFVDFMIKKGAFIGWYFLYMPVGKDPDLSLMPTPEQRKFLLERDIHIRATKSIFIIDFWNDAPYVGGCIAGKKYVHITPKGDVEPCIFTHFAIDNVNKKPLKEIMASPYFKALRKKQPFNENLFLPCQWIDNPEISRELKEKYNIYPTHEGADDILVREDLRRGIDEYSKRVKEIYAPIWEEYKKKNRKKTPKSKKSQK